MSLHIIEQDITTVKVDAIVNSTNHYMYGFSGVDELIHQIGGDKFESECQALIGACVPGEAVHTNAYNLPCKYIIHTVSSGWYGGKRGEAAILRSCYKKSLELAEELGLSSVAFPLISAGSMEYPIAEALKQAVTSISEYLSLYSDMDVYLVLYGNVVTDIAQTIYGDLEQYIEKSFNMEVHSKNPRIIDSVHFNSSDHVLYEESLELNEMINNKSEDFVTMLYRLMDERGIDKPSNLYKNAGVSKATFSKLVSGGSKKPSLETAVGLAMALELPYDTATEFFKSAGIALSNSSKYDIIVSYFIKTGNYNIWDLDIQLVKYGYKSLLGCE